MGHVRGILIVHVIRGEAVQVSTVFVKKNMVGKKTCSGWWTTGCGRKRWGMGCWTKVVAGKGGGTVEGTKFFF